MISRLTRPITQPAADVRSAAPATMVKVQERSIGRTLFVYWHLLSLDAPTVAVLWTVFTAAATHTVLPIATPIAMALTVWSLYASDRLLDTRDFASIRHPGTLDELKARHLFHHRYRAGFALSIILCTIALAALLPLLPPAAIRLYLTEGALMSGYFLLIHAAPKSIPKSRLSLYLSTSPIPKELLVGPFFAAAIFIPTVSRRPELRLELLPLAILFAALCSLNCLYIYAWEHPAGHKSHWTTTYSVRNLNDLTSLFLAASLLCSLSLARVVHAPFGFQLYPLVGALSALLLLAMHKLQEHLSPLVLRAAADAALLTPLITLPYLFHHQA